MLRIWCDSAFKSFISCFLTEGEMRDRKLLPIYKSQRRPELLLAAISKANWDGKEHDLAQALNRPK